MPKKILLTLTVISLFTLVLSPVFAAKPDNAPQGKPIKEEKIRNNEEKIQEVKERVAAKKEEKQQERNERRERVCAAFSERAQQKLQHFADYRGVHVEKYEKLIARLEGLSTKLAAKGYDVTDLKAHLGELSVLVEKYQMVFDEFIASLNYTKGFGCTDKDADFRENMALSKAKLAELKAVRTEIRDFYKDMIRADVKALRIQAEKNATEDEEVNEDEDGTTEEDTTFETDGTTSTVPSSGEGE